MILINQAKIIVTGSDHGVIQFLSSNNLEEKSVIEEEDISGSIVTSLGFSSDSRYLSYASYNGYLKTWSLKNSNIHSEYKLEDGSYITSLAFNQTDTCLVTGSTRGM